jgi:hypothetical protein
VFGRAAEKAGEQVFTSCAHANESFNDQSSGSELDAGLPCNGHRSFLGLDIAALSA